MIKADLRGKKIPDAPGVYFFLGAKKEILYIGRATSLRNRIKSYFTDDLPEKRSELIAAMIASARQLDWTKTDSTLEAMLLEVNLIRTHKPRYNTRSKDDKSYSHLIITNEEYPRVLVVRGKDLTEQYTEAEIKYSFGPFPNNTLFREALKIVQKLFKFYDTPTPIGQEKSVLARGQIDFNRQIGLYPDNHDLATYGQTIRHLRLLFEGKKRQLVTELKRNMRQLAKAEEFEVAEKIKRRIFALEHIQDVALIRDDTRVYRDEKSIRIEAYDIAHLAGQDMVGVMVVIEGEEPKKSEYRKFKIQSLTSSNDVAALCEILERRLQHDEWPLPQLIVVDGGKAQKNVTEKTLKKFGLVIPVIAVVKDLKHRPVRLIAPRSLITIHKSAVLLANAEAHRFAVAFHRTKRKIS